MLLSTLSLDVCANEIHDNVSYKEAIEEIITSINERDSYYYEITNPEDSINYLKSLDIDIPDDLNRKSGKKNKKQLQPSIFPSQH